VFGLFSIAFLVYFTAFLLITLFFAFVIEQKVSRARQGLGAKEIFGAYSGKTIEEDRQQVYDRTRFKNLL
jgi:hypothetical protein